MKTKKQLEIEIKEIKEYIYDRAQLYFDKPLSKLIKEKLCSIIDFHPVLERYTEDELCNHNFDLGMITAYKNVIN